MNNFKNIEKTIETIKQRKSKKSENSYTNYLFEKGKEKILKKISEESGELIIASMKNDKEEIVDELCDLIFHIAVLCVDIDISLEDIENTFEKRAQKIGNFKGERKKIEHF